jgi:glycine cleavage system H protein
MKSKTINFTKDHIWLSSLGDDEYHVGITDYAQDLLGDIVFIELKENQLIKRGEPFGVIESVKTASDLIAPCDLNIASVNSELLENLLDVNDKPYDSWICVVNTKTDFESMNKDDYEKLVG